ncbi:hypothetical protein VTN77DRAFT_1457 [Rasamsonia byssochlamydoides]|uniref:uncharacterized protein n=1 Tax=Rasamsonia byssochlamydoides TaxID=89139 RepID=UPI0037428E6E
MYRRREQRESPVATGEEIPACQSCRRRKLRCSRETPSCSQCSRLSCPCVYDRKKQKPGLKSGAVESLNRRLEVLERILLNGNGDGQARSPAAAGGEARGCVYHAALLIANSVNGIGGDRNGNPDTPSGAAPWHCQRQISLNSARGFSAPAEPQVKKRRTGDDPMTTSSDDSSTSPPSPHILEAIFGTYFSKIHPWLPCVHQPTFEARLENHGEAKKMEVLVHAMICATMRHVPLERLGITAEDRDRQIRISRDVVMRNAMADLSVENLQALIIVASYHMGEGNLTSAWPIIGSLTRTVEYLQLTIEADEKPQHAFLRPLTLLEDSRSWAEAEERRRVFWNVFLLDRLCSITTGWSTSLTSDDVRRRLPCDGKIWARGERAITPYFGIWDKSAAKIGNPITYIQRSPQTSPDAIPSSKMSETSPASNSSNVGAFAYRIEATESLSQVTSFFLQQPVNFRNRQEVGSWLTRFKELDLRLVHWKLFLPPKWKDSNVSRDETVVKMDPNLTLAHITHNTSMILLHQHIAYPPAELSEIVKLPSSCSAETCQLAAIETSSISQKYLKYTNSSEIVTAQFAFCAFVAARVLLVHWKFHGTALAQEFFKLVESLQDMSRRWQGFLSDQTQADQRQDIAARYASLLQALHAKCMSEPDLRAEELFDYDLTSDLNVNASRDHSFHVPELRESASAPYSVDNAGPSTVAQGYPVDPGSSSSRGFENAFPGPNLGTLCNAHAEGSLYNSISPRNADASIVHPTHQQDPAGIVSHLSSPANHNIPTTNVETSRRDHPTGPENNNNRQNIDGCGGDKNTTEDELTMMSNVLLGQQFSELDRVITLDGTDFAFDLSMSYNSYWGSLAEM